MAAALEVPPAPQTHAKHMASKAHSCPSCGTNMMLERGSDNAQRRVVELEAQVEMLKEKATAAVDKCADYEDQVRSMKTSQNGNGLFRTNTNDSLQPTARLSNEEPRPSTASSLSAKATRFSFLTSRRGSPFQSTTPANPTLSATSPPDTELLEQLERERALRTKAEEKARKQDSEIEELSVQLFSQANEMVAEERRARAKLEARVELLEKRDREKMGRLERLEKAVSRIDRVKAMLAAPSPTPLGRKS